MANNKPIVIYCFFTIGKLSGAGALTRAEAVYRAVERAGLIDRIDFRLAGICDKDQGGIPASLTNVKREAEENSSLILDLKSEDYDRDKYITELCTQLRRKIEPLHPDLVIIDSFPVYLGTLITPNNVLFRPKNVWAVVKQTPGLFYGIAYRSFDRVYQIEPFEPQRWSESLVRERCRSVAEIELGIKDKSYQEPFPTEDFSKHQEWYERNHKKARKLIPPIVIVEKERVLDRATARKALLAHAGYSQEEIAQDDGARALILTAVTTGGITEKDALVFDNWQAAQLAEWGMTEDKLTDCYQLKVGGPDHPPLPELWRYMAGVEFFIANSSYNLFYETRYLKNVGIFQGRAAFYPLSDLHPDHIWRGVWQERLAAEANPNFTGEAYDNEPNGANVLASFIAKKFGI